MFFHGQGGLIVAFETMTRPRITPMSRYPTPVQTVRYGQHVSVDDRYLNAVAYPSGGGMGHALWVISDDTHRIGYASHLNVVSESTEPGSTGGGASYALEFEPGTLRGLSALVLGAGCTSGQRRVAAEVDGGRRQEAADSPSVWRIPVVGGADDGPGGLPQGPSNPRLHLPAGPLREDVVPIQDLSLIHI